jgi:hypothetical protein
MERKEQSDIRSVVGRTDLTDDCSGQRHSEEERLETEREKEKQKESSEIKGSEVT